MPASPMRTASVASHKVLLSVALTGRKTRLLKRNIWGACQFNSAYNRHRIFSEGDFTMPTLFLLAPHSRTQPGRTAGTFTQ
jgi:hypothetical protein